MKIIEGMKQIKDLQRKAEDIRNKIKQHCVDYDVETPIYENQGNVVSGWLQAHTDICKEILRLRLAIQRTNLATNVIIEIGGKTITKTIAEWVHRRRDLATEELSAWQMLTDKGLKEGTIKQTSGETRELKIRRYYSPEERDRFIDIYKSEPLLIDAKLEVINAVTDLME